MAEPGRGKKVPLGMTYQQHVLDEHLEAYVLRQLQEEETEVLEDHLLFCHNCQQRFTETQQRIQATRTAASRIREEEERSSFRRPLARFFSSLVVSRPAWAAVAAVAVALVVFTPRLQQSSLSYEDVSLTVMRGEEAAFDADHGRRLRLRLDVRDLEVSAIGQITIVSAEGAPVWTSSRIDRPTADSLVVSIDRKLDAGQHWVRVLGSPDQILREYSLRLR